MPRTGATIYDLLLSCPGDVVDLKDIVKECVDDFNRLYGNLNNIKVELKHWSSDSFPQSGGKPQELLNQQFIHGCDACVALFANKFGTPTDRYDSGTEEEIEDMVNSGKQVFLYFIERPIDPSTIDLKQLEKVREFKEKYSDKGIYSIIKSNEEFRKSFLNHLTLYFLQLISEPQETKLTNRTPKLLFLMSDSTDNAVVTHSRFSTAKLFFGKEKEINEVIKQIDEIEIEKIEEKKDDYHQDKTVTENPFLNPAISKQLASSLKNISGLNIPGFAAPKYVKASIDQETKDIIEEYCNEKNISIKEEFWELGDLEKEVRSIITPYGGDEKYRGAEGAEKKYKLISDLWFKVFEYKEYYEFFKAIDELFRLECLISNKGSMYDEDIDVKVIIPKGYILKINELPIPGMSCIEEINENNLSEILFCGRKSDDIDKYSDYPMETYLPFEPVITPFNRPSATRQYETQKKKYMSKISSLFCYEVFPKEVHDVLVFNINYLKQNTSMHLPTHLLFKELPEYIEYEIKSKHVPEIICGRLDIKK